MNIKDMQYDLKSKLNKIDSSQAKDLLVPEMDWKLNEALDIFIKSVALPRYSQTMGFEKTQRNIEDIRTIIRTTKGLASKKGLSEDSRVYYIEIPEDYAYFVSAKADISKGSCKKNMVKCFVRKHGDLNEESPFDSSSFEWEDINILFDEKGIAVYTDGTFTIDKLYLDYVYKHPYIHNAEDYSVGGYELLDGTSLTGTQDCLLPEHTHREIVDIAVLLITGDLIPDYQVKQQKLNINKFN